MGGGGFMKDAMNANRSHRAQRMERRKKFNGNHADKTSLKGKKLKVFSHNAVARQRRRVHLDFQRETRKKRGILLVAAFMTFTVLLWIYLRLRFA